MNRHWHLLSGLGRRNWNLWLFDCWKWTFKNWPHIEIRKLAKSWRSDCTFAEKPDSADSTNLVWPWTRSKREPGASMSCAFLHWNYRILLNAERQTLVKVRKFKKTSACLSSNKSSEVNYRLGLHLLDIGDYEGLYLRVDLKQLIEIAFDVAHWRLPVVDLLVFLELRLFLFQLVKPPAVQIIDSFFCCGPASHKQSTHASWSEKACHVIDD